jgi:hypothetical protein
MNTKKVIQTVNAYFNVDIIKHDRKITTVKARNIVCHLLRESGLSFNEIGDAINRGHHSAMHAINMVHQNPESYADDIATIRDILDLDEEMPINPGSVKAILSAVDNDDLSYDHKFFMLRGFLEGHLKE